MAARRRPLAVLIVLAALVVVEAATSRAEIYRWTDGQGRVHFTQDLHQVPVEQRAAAEEAAQKPPGRSPVQVFSSPAAPSRSPIARATRSQAGAVYRIPVQRAGSSMTVSVRINGRLDVPFHIDTGASDVVLPKWAADQLGLDLEGARTGIYSTANGLVQQKLVRLTSVALGGAEVSDVPATVSEQMHDGLLGLSYFNHFKYDIDPVAGVVTLRHNDLAETGVLRGGRSQYQWQQQFAAARHRIRSMETKRDEVPFSRSRKRREIESEIAKLEHELKLLVGEADDARVPSSWRE